MRTTISLDDEVAELADKMATAENGNFSNLCEVALKTYCAPAAAMSVDDDRLLAKAKVEMLKNAKYKRDLAKLTAQSERERLGK